MIITLNSRPSSHEYSQLMQFIEQAGCTYTEVRTQYGYYIVMLSETTSQLEQLEHLPIVLDIHAGCQLVSRQWKGTPTIIDLGDQILLGEGYLGLIFGPCAIETEQQIDQVITFLTKQQVKLVRGGAFKPRTSPYTFRGLGIDGLKMFHAKLKAHGMRVISEVLDSNQVEQMYDHVDIFQVGARNSQNYHLLGALGDTDKPVLLKRGVSGTLEELLQSAEYIFSNGNERIILCERGIRTYEKAYRNTLDLNAIPVLKEKSHLPVIVDPSHGIGIRKHVAAMALAAVMCGADGVMVETHPVPDQALSDGMQSLDFEEAQGLISRLREGFLLRESFRS